MRRLTILSLALGLFLALPAASATAQEQIAVTVSTAEAQTGVGHNDSSITEGSYTVAVDGAVFETGAVHSQYLGQDRVKAVRTYRDAVSGNELVTSARGLLLDFDDVNVVFTYKVIEKVVSSTAGVTGRGTGIATAYGNPDGFTLESSLDFVLNL